jgi:phosphomannomutase
MSEPTKTDPIKIYDARWETDEFTPLEIQRFVEAVLIYGRGLGVDTVTIARDARSGSGSVMEIALESAVKAGFTVFLCADPISTPQSYFLSFWASKDHPKTMGLTITASHNPANYVGLKVVVPGVQAIGLNCGPAGGFSKIREIYHGPESLKLRAGGKLTIVDPTERYLRFSMQAAGIEDGELDGMRVVLDALNGSAGPELCRGLQQAGVFVLPLRLIPDGTFPTGSPNPTSQNKMDEAVQLAGRTGADLVIGTDGDGDRLVFGNTRGIMNAGFASIPILRKLLSGGSASRTAFSESPKIIYDPKVNPLALVEWAKLDIKPVLFGNGHSQIKEHMRRIGALAAVEESGHYYHSLTAEGFTFFAENSLVTVLLLAKALRENPELMGNMWALQDRVFTTGEINYQMADDKTRDRSLQAVLQYFKDDHAVLVSETAEGVDLLGTVVSKGVDLEAGKLEEDWYNGYLRVATNEKSVLRIYLSAGIFDLGMQIEQKIRDILGRYPGNAID